MWVVYEAKKVSDTKYGNRTVEIKRCEGSYESCIKYAEEHPETYVVWTMY